MTASLVQSKSNGATTGASLTVTFTSAVTAGNAVVVGIGAAQGTTVPTVSGVTLGSSALSKANSLGGGSGQDDVEFWILANAPSGQTVVTITFTGGSGSSISLQAWAMEWSGLATSGLLDTAPAGGTGTSTTFSSNSTGTLTNANEVVFGAAAVATLTGTVTAPGSPWTELATLGSSTTLKLVVGYQVVSATTAQTYSGTISASSQWHAIIISLNQPVTAVSGTVPPLFPVPRRQLARAVWAGIAGQAFVQVPAPRQQPGPAPRRVPARAVWRGIAGQAFVAVAAPRQQPPVAPRRRPARAYIQFRPVRTVNQAAFTIPGTVQPLPARPAPRRTPARAVWAGTTVRTVNAVAVTAAGGIPAAGDYERNRIVRKRRRLFGMGL